LLHPIIEGKKEKQVIFEKIKISFRTEIKNNTFIKHLNCKIKMTGQVLGNVGKSIVEAEVLDAFRKNGGLQVKFRVNGYASPAFHHLKPNDSRMIMEHYDAMNPDYLSGHSVYVHYRGSHIVGIELNGSH